MLKRVANATAGCGSVWLAEWVLSIEWGIFTFSAMAVIYCVIVGLGCNYVWS